MAPCSGEDASLPSIGDRVVDDNGFRSTVRYVGSVCTAKDQTSVWIGERFCLSNKYDDTDQRGYDPVFCISSTWAEQIGLAIGGR